MSDIYLQITETPTVVTLSAPVVSGALSSTVTVANTVTVALDANSLSALENVTVTVGAAITGTVTVSNSVTISSLPAISGTVTLGAGTSQIGSVTASISGTVPISISSVTVGVLPDLTTSTNFEQAGVQIAAGINGYGSIPVAILAGTAQIGSVTVGNSVTIGSLPSLVAGTAQIGVVTIGNIRRSGDGALTQLSTEVGSGALQTVIGAGTAQIGSVTASISNSVVTFYPLQGTTVSNTNFTSVTASTTLVSAVAGREVLTVFNEGAGNLHISPGATCTTVAYQVRLSAGDYWECPAGQLSLGHVAVFATAGTARVCQVS